MNRAAPALSSDLFWIPDLRSRPALVIDQPVEAERAASGNFKLHAAITASRVFSEAAQLRGLPCCDDLRCGSVFNTMWGSEDH
jgi:hypothetical protein